MTKLDDPQALEKILRSVRKHVINKSWRETHLNVIHNAIYGFNLPATTRNPHRITSCPKCNKLLTDAQHGLWNCNNIQSYWGQSLGIHIYALVHNARNRPQIHFVHIILLVAKRRVLPHWLKPSVPTIDMLVDQLKLYLISNRIKAERGGNERWLAHVGYGSGGFGQGLSPLDRSWHEISVSRRGYAQMRFWLQGRSFLT